MIFKNDDDSSQSNEIVRIENHFNKKKCHFQSLTHTHTKHIQSPPTYFNIHRHIRTFTHTANFKHSQ